MKNNFIIIIPARYASSRLPGKPLLDICGKPMLLRVYEKALLANPKQIFIATDSELIYQELSKYTKDIIMTAEHHNSGIERIAEVIEKANIAPDEIIVNLQGDEPLIPVENIIQVAENLAKHNTDIATLGTAIEQQDEYTDPNIVKVVRNNKDLALYFSRATIPFFRDQQPQDLKYALRHIGLYAYRAGYINTYVNYAPSALENLEKLEQLRALYYGDSIHVDVAKVVPPVGVDTMHDLINVRNIVSSQQA